MKKQAILLFLSLSAIFCNLYADDYQEQAQKMRVAVWNWDMEVFKNHSIPEQYRNESAVIIARHQQIEATSKNKFNLNALFSMDMNRQLYYTNIDRIMIRLNDQSALDNYSELSFQKEAKSRGLWRSNKLKTIIGARIIKPDGSILDIDVDTDAVAITEGKKDKETFNLLAIKGLEIGDILDYFYAEEMALETLNAPPLLFTFFSPQYPTLTYSIECILGEKLTVEYRAVNGAPDFEKSEDGDKNIILKATQKDLKVIDNMDEIRWLSPYRELPMIRMMILNNSSKLIPKPANARKNGVYKDVSYEDILKDKKCEFASWNNRMHWIDDIYKKVNKVLTNYKQQTPTATSNDLALYIYDVLRFYWPNTGPDYPQEKFYIALNKLLKENQIESKICFTTNRYGSRQTEIVEAGDLSVFVSANNNKHLFFYPNGYRYAGEIPSGYEGENVSAVSVNKYKPGSAIGIEGAESQFEIPKSSFEDNMSLVIIDVSLSEENPLELKINRNLVCSGDMKSDYQQLIVLYEDWDQLMRKRLLIETDFWQDMQNDKDGRKYIDQYKTLFEERRKEQKELMQAELKEYHSTNSGELIRYSVKSLGATPEEPFLELQTEYTMDGLIKKAGNNLLLEVGKLIGTQWVPSEKERKRELDSYINAPILIEKNISIAIPAQYRVEGIESLEQNIENEWGKFASSASLEGNFLKITTIKVYKTNFVPRNAWHSLLEMIDKTNEFCSRSIILKQVDSPDEQINVDVPDEANHLPFSPD